MPRPPNSVLESRRPFWQRQHPSRMTPAMASSCPVIVVMSQSLARLADIDSSTILHAEASLKASMETHCAFSPCMHLATCHVGFGTGHPQEACKMLL